MNTKKMVPVLSIVAPCYNEEEVLVYTLDKISSLLNDLIDKGKVSNKSNLCLVDDGSRDKTWQIIEEASQNNGLVKGVKLSGNFGHQNALIAGIFEMMKSADCIVSVDADLQDDILVIEDMVDRFVEGDDIVYGVRDDRQNDTFFKKYTAQFFYKLMDYMKVKTVYNHADYRLCSKRVAEELFKFKEFNLYLRGIFPIIGFQSSSVFYKRNKRIAGESKYPLSKMLAFAWDGITSFSGYPLQIIFKLGLFIFLLSVILIMYVMYIVISERSVPGWASTVITISLFSGLQMISLGVVGEYIRKVYAEVKGRPRFIVEKVVSQ